MMKNDSKISLTIFCILTLASGWLGYLLDQFLAAQNEQETLGMGLWLVLPLVTSLLIRFVTEDWKDIGLRPNLLRYGIWYSVAVIVYPAVTLLVVMLGKFLGWIDTSTFTTDLYTATLLAALLPNFIKNIFEEFVWRGYLTRKLIDHRTSDLGIYLLVGGVWGAWHIPYYVFFLPESTLAQVLPVGLLPFILVSIFTMICWTVMYVELYRITKSIWPVVVLHMVEDSIVNHLILDRHIVINDHHLLISPIAGLLTTSCYLCIGLWLRKKRIDQRYEKLYTHRV
jgi:membrane protease YdiL (CAAX protease family)